MEKQTTCQVHQRRVQTWNEVKIKICYGPWKKIKEASCSRLEGVLRILYFVHVSMQLNQV